MCFLLKKKKKDIFPALILYVLLALATCDLTANLTFGWVVGRGWNIFYLIHEIALPVFPQ